MATKADVQRPTLRGVIFDMDGTLTVPNHDFALMYRRVGCVTGDILSEIETFDEARRNEANRIIHEMETEALEGMRVMPFATELGAYLDGLSIPRGLVTRNVTMSVDHFHVNHWCKQKATGQETTLKPFHPALARDFKPYKPAPDALLKICEVWDIDPRECVMIGDSAKDDVVAGNRAGCVTILLDQTGKWKREEDLSSVHEENDDKTSFPRIEDNGVALKPEDAILRGEMVPTHIVRCLSEIREILEERFNLSGGS